MITVRIGTVGGQHFIADVPDVADVLNRLNHQVVIQIKDARQGRRVFIRSSAVETVEEVDSDRQP